MSANFASDNTAPVHPAILDAITAAGQVAAMPYGADEWTGRLSAMLNEVFEREVLAFPVPTGTAANALALSALCPPWGAVYGHPASHAFTDECGAPEFFTGGARMTGVPGANGRVEPDALEAALAGARPHAIHNPKPAALTLTQASEAGTVYTADAVAALAEVARGHGLRVHMDGARFANAVAAGNAAPADLTWRAGVDVLSLGATKDGAMAAEAVVFFDPALAEAFEERRKRGGHLFSKQRFAAAQFAAWLEGGLWLDLARTANARAARLGAGLAARAGVVPAHPVEANIVFADLPAAAVDGLEAAGFLFYRAGAVPADEAGEGGRERVRLVCSWSTTEGEVDALLAALDGILRDGA